jgi:hypothetical protein
MFACTGAAGGGSGGSSGDATTTGTSTMTSVGSTGDTASSVADTSEGSSSTAGSSSSDGSTSTGGGSSDSGGVDSSETGLGDCIPLLVEAFYDADAPSDDNLQWVKLYNPCAVDVDLSTWSLGYARGDLGDVDLYTAGVKGFVAPPTLGAGDCFLVGGPTSEAANGDPDFEFPDDFMPGLFAPDTAGAGIALFDLAVIDLLSVPRDAVVYGANNDNALVDETGAPVAVPHVAGSAAGGSIRRTGAAPTWEAAAVPTPNVCPPF